MSAAADGPGALRVGGLYNRGLDLHGRFGGQRRGGIVTPAGGEVVLVFTGEVGQRFGYHDRWLGPDAYLYFGEGQHGDMVFTRGNRAVRDHAEANRRLLLFEIAAEENGLCRYLGEFRCADWAWLEAPDRTGRSRRAIAFTLRRCGAA